MGLRRRLLLLAILATGIASSVAIAQEPCGGITGTLCTDPGEFCELLDGECCCDFVGTCTPIPQGCPAVFDPVCGCDGHTYSSRCEAHRNSVSVDHVGPCAAGPEVTGVRFTGPHEMVWDAMPGALAYNVYIDRGPSTTDTPGFNGVCLLSPLPAPRAVLDADPPSDVLFKFEVTAMYENGEGALGRPSPGFPPRAVISCTCTLPADVGPCDGVCPRWFFDYVDGRCEEFIWGCCGGNANNFLTEATCAATCPMSP
jgi:hypothetical protein